MPGGRPQARAASCAHSASIRLVPGWPVFALPITGLPAAIAATKSPPATELNANGKLFGPKTTTGPPRAACIERMLALLSIVARHHERSRAAAAPWRIWSVARGSSTDRRRGVTGRPVSRAASSTSASARASIRAAQSSRKRAIVSGETPRSTLTASSAAANARVTSGRPDTGYSSASGVLVVGSTAEKTPTGASACRHSPPISMGSMDRFSLGRGNARMAIDLVLQGEGADRDANEISSLEGEVVRRDDAGAGHQKDTLRKGELPPQVADQLLERAPDLRRRRLALRRPRDRPAAR